MIRLTVTVPRQQFQKLSLDVRLWAQPGIRHRLLTVIGRRFWEITRNNMGPAGEARPTVWKELEDRYRKQVAKRAFRNEPVPTLVRSGTLRRSIEVRVSEEYAIIESNNPYAAAHQFGNASRNLSPRPYFPIIGSPPRLTDYAHAKLVEAALKELKNVT